MHFPEAIASGEGKARDVGDSLFEAQFAEVPVFVEGHIQSIEVFFDRNLAGLCVFEGIIAEEAAVGVDVEVCAFAGFQKE